ncbi:unnamed protein product [Urochloa humidicola]
MASHGIKMTVPAGEPTAVAAPLVPPVAAGDILGGGGVVINPPPPKYVVLGEQEDVDFTDENLSDDDGDDTDDSDSESEEEGGQPQLPAPEVDLMADIEYLVRPARVACVHNTAMFMHVTSAAAAAAPGGEILMHYRCTHFMHANGGGDQDGVVASNVQLGPMLARLRFHLPAHAAADDDTASSLQLAGAALAPLLYPSCFRAKLRALWCCLVKGWPAPHAARVVVTVDVGILRPCHFTPARMRSMGVAMESTVRERDGQPAEEVFDVGTETELLLPVPLVKEDDVRPTKRRRVAGENCPICCEALKRKLAAWPRCSHIFHIRCLGEYLVRGAQKCPMCRSGLQVDAHRRVSTV